MHVMRVQALSVVLLHDSALTGAAKPSFNLVSTRSCGSPDSQHLVRNGNVFFQNVNQSHGFCT